MDQETRAFVTEQSKLLEAAPMTRAEAKEAAAAWLAAAGTDAEAAATAAYIPVLKASVELIDELVAFGHSDTAVQVFGAEAAAGFAAHADALKASGALYCDCPACSAALAILRRLGEVA